MQIYVSNLHASFIEADVQRLFFRFGEVAAVRLMRDKLNNRSQGRAFVDMPVQQEALQAILNLHGNEVNGKKLSVSEVTYDPAPNASWSLSRNI